MTNNNNLVKLQEWLRGLGENYTCDQLRGLQVLRLDDKQIAELPESIGNLSDLQILYLDYNQITKLSESIGELSNLRVLYLRSNHIREIPESLCKLSKLETLDLTGNPITCLPKSFKKIENLCINSNVKFISTADTNLIKLQDWLRGLGHTYTIDQLRGLKVLNLSGRQIAKLPESIGELSNLQELNLNGNQISALPDSICKLSNLRGVHLINNQIRELPDSICKLSNLRELYLLNNQISVLPDSIGDLSNLKYLYLNGNQISELPESLNKLQWSRINNNLVFKSTPTAPQNTGLVTVTQAREMADKYQKHWLEDEQVINAIITNACAKCERKAIVQTQSLKCDIDFVASKIASVGFAVDITPTAIYIKW